MQTGLHIKWTTKIQLQLITVNELLIGLLTSCHPHRVTTGWSNSVTCECTLCHMRMHITSHADAHYKTHLIQYVNPFTSQIYKISLCTNKTRIHRHQTQTFQELVPSILPLFKKHLKLGHAGIVNHSISFTRHKLLFFNM